MQGHVVKSIMAYHDLGKKRSLVQAVNNLSFMDAVLTDHLDTYNAPDLRALDPHLLQVPKWCNECCCAPYDNRLHTNMVNGKNHVSCIRTNMPCCRLALTVSA